MEFPCQAQFASSPFSRSCSRLPRTDIIPLQKEIGFHGRGQRPENDRARVLALLACFATRFCQGGGIGALAGAVPFIGRTAAAADQPRWAQPLLQLPRPPSHDSTRR